MFFSHSEESGSSKMGRLSQGVFHAVAVKMLTGVAGSASKVAHSFWQVITGSWQISALHCIVLYCIVLYCIVLLECPHNMVEVGFPTVSDLSKSKEEATYHHLGHHSSKNKARIHHEISRVWVYFNNHFSFIFFQFIDELGLNQNLAEVNL
ncbi:hypothetical protein H1C71_026850 [Ictidomys tridecemlineatus]|nr:hypothetical protein H1C71_026850 [Ictidomys tridecemlineatus]KAG3290438.1 hypothetical protein H1C71_026850 [Ictidomys tridecemlineatus]KAG3290439.1 hypothetical protein H1C71_026850 [Ictidomys tridecemlineatus]KAG3290440.1 hypothetical protein H1C71_026850 [Ictidomys tridecemlineatus]KAG3290441.1 hypothetical protein H1C71_026850 [Ictidomys tridecemlineatus]